MIISRRALAALGICLFSPLFPASLRRRPAPREGSLSPSRILAITAGIVDGALLGYTIIPYQHQGLLARRSFKAEDLVDDRIVRRLEKEGSL